MILSSCLRYSLKFQTIEDKRDRERRMRLQQRMHRLKSIRLVQLRRSRKKIRDDDFGIAVQISGRQNRSANRRRCAAHVNERHARGNIDRRGR